MGDNRAPHYALLVQFLAALLQRTLGCSTQETHQQALQGFLDDLTPWISPADLPRRLGQPFTLFDHLALTPHGADGDADVWMAFSVEGQVVFRAWLRHRGLDPLGCSSYGDRMRPASLHDLPLERSRRAPQASRARAAGPLPRGRPVPPWPA